MEDSIGERSRMRLRIRNEKKKRQPDSQTGNRRKGTMTERRSSGGNPVTGDSHGQLGSVQLSFRFLCQQQLAPPVSAELPIPTSWRHLPTPISRSWRSSSRNSGILFCSDPAGGSITGDNGNTLTGPIDQRAGVWLETPFACCGTLFSSFNSPGSSLLSAIPSRIPHHHYSTLMPFVYGGPR